MEALPNVRFTSFCQRALCSLVRPGIRLGWMGLLYHSRRILGVEALFISREPLESALDPDAEICEYAFLYSPDLLSLSERYSFVSVVRCRSINVDATATRGPSHFEAAPLRPPLRLRFAQRRFRSAFCNGGATSLPQHQQPCLNLRCITKHATNDILQGLRREHCACWSSSSRRKKSCDLG